jgi:CHAT domain-containing protein
VLIGPDATEAAVRAALPGRRVVHLATHGCLVDGAPQLSAVLLADGDHLTVDELIGLDLDVDLVVLSACDTARGEVTEGNEVVGLARALVGVGARAAVVSLWTAPDLATCLLMRRFYDRRRRGVPGPRALAEAQRDLASTSFDDQLDEYLALPDDIRGEGPSTEQTQVIASRSRGTAAEPGGATGTNAWAPFVYLGLD